MEINEVGVVRNDVDETKKQGYFRDVESIIEVKEEFADGLQEIERSGYLQVIFYFSRSEDYDLVGPRHGGKIRGVFASRSPHRPNNLGSTVVKLLSRDGATLKVEGLDAINGTPVVDIKPYAAPFDSSSPPEEKKEDPRRKIRRLVKTGDLENLLLKAGELHGHYCPFLALGVMAGNYALNQLGEAPGDMEKLVAVLETNSCFSDGIQYSTGCTFGNNALVYRDYGKTAVTMAIRGDRGVRLYYKEDNYLKENYPERTELFDRVVKEREGTEEDERALKRAWTEIAFDLIHVPVEDIFKVEQIRTPDLPDYAPIYEDGYCDLCGEKFMAPKGVGEEDGPQLCIPCAGGPYLQLDGSGLREVG
ncbi:tRNA (N6-threonylcarbamoyladenosine(37)-N6)-methyltransferase TrmO [Candidatus Bipolaricaulota bacterium]|nr:tRNA (N6-threonylcarbamoyladenosine(37)-N6)-methyltransferase TrmO [Candidatus Bipolaricaulota bacterium]